MDIPLDAGYEQQGIKVMYCCKKRNIYLLVLVYCSRCIFNKCLLYIYIYIYILHTFVTNMKFQHILHF